MHEFFWQKFLTHLGKCEQMRKKMLDKEVRTACCKQRAPDVKDIQISAQNTPLFLPNHWRHKSMKEKTPKKKQLLHYKSTK